MRRTEQHALLVGAAAVGAAAEVLQVVCELGLRLLQLLDAVPVCGTKSSIFPDISAGRRRHRTCGKVESCCWTEKMGNVSGSSAKLAAYRMSICQSAQWPP